MQVGDVMEVTTSKGLAYLQFTHEGMNHYKGFQTMRQIDGFFKERPTDLVALADLPTIYHFRCLLKLFIKDKVFTKIGNAPVPRKDREPPSFRSGWHDPANDGKIVGGWISKGSDDYRVVQFTPEQQKFSLDGMWTNPTIIDNLEIGWRPELDISVTGNSHDPLKQVRDEYYKRIGFKPDEIKLPKTGTIHYFIFKSLAKAEAAKSDIEAQGLKVEEPQTADDKAWLIVARQQDVPDDAASLDSKFEKIAKKFGGIYDGSETYVGPWW